MGLAIDNGDFEVHEWESQSGAVGHRLLQTLVH